MIGLTITCVRMMFRMCFACIDLMFVVCTLGKLDPKTRNFI